MQHQKLTKDIINELHQYEDIFSHHIETILKSRLLLDEDATLLLSYWDDRNSFKGNTKSTYKWDVFAGCLAVAGIISSIKLRMYLLSLLSVPFISNMWVKGYKCFNNYKTKRDFEALVKCLSSMHELNKAAVDYFYQRDIVLVNYQFSNCGNFMNYFYCVLLKTLEEIKKDILLINKTIPVAEPYNMYVVNWDLEQFKLNDFNDYKKTLLQLEKMSDFYVLMVSNFLSCIGLSLCVNIWQSPMCNFRIIFKKVVPSALKFLENSVNELVQQFSQLRYNLIEKVDAKTISLKSLDSKKYVALYKPLDSFLSHLQITFEMAKLLECNLKSNQNEIGTNSNIVTAICNQFDFCNESLHSLVQNYEIILKRSLRPAIRENNSPNESNEELNCLKAETELNKNQDDSIEQLEDEEYNLYVGYSDDEDDDFRTSVDYVDQMPTEYLELMLTELKRKLDDRKRLKEKRLNPLEDCKDVGHKKNLDANTNSEISSIECQSNSKKCKNEDIVPNALVATSTPPPPPLPLKIRNLKDQEQKIAASSDPQQPGFQAGFLNDIKFLAQQLDRKEETFGFGSDSSDSDSEN